MAKCNTEKTSDRTKHRVGRKLNFPKPEDMAKAINAYLEETPFDELTITGLALAIGLCRRDLINYQNRDGFAPIVTNAKAIIEHSYEVALRKNGNAGAIFGLKNFGWADRIENLTTIRDQSKDIEPTMTHQEAAESYSDTLKNGAEGAVVVPIRKTG